MHRIPGGEWGTILKRGVFMSKLKLICGWCQKELGEKEVEGTGGESHGICDDCLRRYFPHHYEKIITALEVENLNDLYKDKPGGRG